MTTTIKRGLMVLISGVVGLGGSLGCGDGHDHSKHDHKEAPVTMPSPAAAPADPNAKPYPLKTCIVSGEELGKMGEPMRFTYKGQEIKLCCKGCEKDFHKDPDKHLQKITSAAGK